MIKSCIICNIPQDIKEYYKHSKMSDGHLNKCKTCCKKQAKEREVELKKDLNWIETEKARAREKYHRLYSKGFHKPTKKKTKRKL